jgi:hypothetical protein
MSQPQVAPRIPPRLLAGEVHLVQLNHWSSREAYESNSELLTA